MVPLCFLALPPVDCHLWSLIVTGVVSGVYGSPRVVTDGYFNFLVTDLELWFYYQHFLSWSLSFLAYRVRRIIILASGMGSGLSLDPYGIFALQRALLLRLALSGVPRYEIVPLCVRMLSVGLRPHIYCHILVRLILCARMSAKYLFSNVERGSIPPHTLPHSHAPHSTVRLTLYKGLRPLLSVHDLYSWLYAPLFLASWYNFLHCGLRILNFGYGISKVRCPLLVRISHSIGQCIILSLPDYSMLLALNLCGYFFQVGLFPIFDSAHSRPALL